MKKAGIIIMLILLLSGCGQTKEEVRQPDTFVLALEELGYQVVTEKVEANIFTGDRYLLWLNDEEDFTISVYGYDNEKQAIKEASGIRGDGFEIAFPDENGNQNISMVDWISEPHFFLYENLLVQYIGTDETVLQDLLEICGPQIAGAAVTKEEETVVYPEVSMRVLEDSITKQGFTLELYNEGEFDLEYGTKYRLQYFFDGNWYAMQEQDAFNDIACILPAGERREQEIVYKGLTKGEYNISKTVWTAQQNGNVVEARVSTEFIVN